MFAHEFDCLHITYEMKHLSDKYMYFNVSVTLREMQ